MRPSNGEMMLIATVLTILFAGLMVFGVRAVARYMKVTFAIVWIGMAIWLVLMLVGSHGTFVSNWNHSSGSTYNGDPRQGPVAGLPRRRQPRARRHPGGDGLLLPGLHRAFSGPATSPARSRTHGARRSPRSSAAWRPPRSSTWSPPLLVYKYYGYKFFGSIVYLGLGGGSSHYTLAFSPYLPSMVKFLPGGQVLGVIVVLCFLLAIFWWTPTGFLLGTRNLFAWSFDRLAPARVTEVSDRFHTPVVATVVVALVVELLNYLNIYQGLGAFLLNVLVIMGLAFIVVSIAAGTVPYRRAAMHADAPGWARARVLGVPVITLVSLVSGLSWAFVIYAALHTGFGGKLGWGPMIKVFVAPIIAIVWYLGVSAVPAQPGNLAHQHVPGDPARVSSRRCDEFTVYYASDIHGSDRLWRKFVNAGKFYDADVLVMGGDITGKAVVPIDPDQRRAACARADRRRVAPGEELESLETQIRNRGFYPYVTTEDELAAAHGDEQAIAELFRRAMADSVRALAEARRGAARRHRDPAVHDARQRRRAGAAGGSGRVAAGRRLRGHRGGARRPDPDAVVRDRQPDALELAARAARGAAGRASRAAGGAARRTRRAASSTFTCRRRGRRLDQAPELDATLKPVVRGGSVAMISAGSQAVRELIERYQPLVALHGHIHESRGDDQDRTHRLHQPRQRVRRGRAARRPDGAGPQEGLRNHQLVSG